jgi:DNA repair protein RecN (Recombination protein N)
VAAQGTHHLRVRQAGTEATIDALSEDERIEELARMLGGVKITAQTRAHAAEMRAQGS